MTSAQADLGLDPHRMFFRYTTPVLDTGDFQVIPGNIYNLIELPCDGVHSFGGQYDTSAESARVRDIGAFSHRRFQVFAQGDNHNVWHNYWNGRKWARRLLILLSSVASDEIVARPPGRAHVRFPASAISRR